MNNAKIVVFDVDDVLWSLNRRVSEITGIDYNKFTTFSIHDNTLLTEDEKRTVLQVYQGHELFEEMKFYSGVTRINQLNADVRINSNACSEAAAELKRNQVSGILNLPAEKIVITVVDDIKKKKMDDNVFVFVDDSPYNIAASKATFNIVPKKPWNDTDEARKIMRQNGVGFIYVDDLQQAIDVVEMLLADNSMCRKQHICKPRDGEMEYKTLQELGFYYLFLASCLSENEAQILKQRWVSLGGINYKPWYQFIAENVKVTLESQIPVITTYSFDDGATVAMFPTDEQAEDYLEEMFNKEVAHDKENGYDCVAQIQKDKRYAKIVNHFEDKSDVTEFHIGYILPTK